MDNFSTNGHISPEGFDKLIRGSTTDLERLEFSEHLSFCELCFDTYTKALDEPADYPQIPFEISGLAGKITQKESLSKFRIYMSASLAAAVAVLFINLCLFSPTFTKNLAEKTSLLKIPQAITNITEKFESIQDKISDNLETKIFKEDLQWK